MPSSTSFPRSSRKRSHPEPSLTDGSLTHATPATSPGALSLLLLEEPPTQRARRDVLSTQLETLQAELDHERNLRQLDQKRFQQMQQRLERQVEFAAEEAQEAKALMEEVREQSEEYAETLRSKHKALQDEFRKLQYALDAAQANSAHEAAMEDPRVEQLEAQLEAHLEEKRGLQEIIVELQEHVEKLAAELASKSTTPQENPVLKASPAPPQVMKELNQLRIQLAEQERKNRQWKRHAEEWQQKAKEGLQHQERAKSAQARVQVLEQQLQDNHATLSTVQAELASWKDFGTNMVQVLTAATRHPGALTLGKPNLPPEISVVRRYLNEATKEAQEAQSQNQQLQTQLEQADDKMQQLERTIRELEQSKLSLEKQLIDAEKKLQVVQHQLDVNKGQEAVWKREVSSLRSIVETFDELAIPTKAASSQAQDARVKMVQASLDAATEELKVIKESQATLRTELDTAMTAKAQLQSKHNTVLEKFNKLKEAVYTERAKAEKAEARAVQAETLAGKGSFNPNTTRVMHMQHNPLTEALKQEVNVLRRQVETLTAGSNKKAAVSTTPGSDVDPNKLHQRLKESFKEQIGRFREGVYLLTGYKIDMIPDGENPKFKVRSLFAEREQDHLMFQWPTVTPVESLDLLDTELAKLLMTTPSYEYVTRFGSMPAFLASTQLSLFEKQTIM